jgi:hypothetical protein
VTPNIRKAKAISRSLPVVNIVRRFATNRDARATTSKPGRRFMKTNYRIAIALVAGAAIGGAAIQELHAQAKPPAYLIIPILKINDPDAFKAGVLDKGLRLRQKRSLKAVGTSSPAKTSPRSMGTCRAA